MKMYKPLSSNTQNTTPPMSSTRPHALFVPFPAQGHMNPCLKLAKFLYYAKGFYITFVLTEFNYGRLLRSRGPEAVQGLENFRFATIPDGLPSSSEDRTQDIKALCASTRATCLAPLKDLIVRLNGDRGVPKVSCIVVDGGMSFAVDVGDEFGVPVMLFVTHSGCGFWSYCNIDEVVSRGYTPIKDESYLTNGYLDTPINFIPGLHNIRLRDLPTFIRTTKHDDSMINLLTERNTSFFPRASGIILNTFDELEAAVVSAACSKLGNIYTIGPLCSIDIPCSITTNLWKENEDCTKWLDKEVEHSVLYVNFGSITVVSKEQFTEFAWGLASSGYKFLWVVRPDMVHGQSVTLLDDEDFTQRVKGKGLIVQWCDQERVLSHQAIGAFLTHCGWNSTLESICNGVPMICWPFFAEQQMNCRYLCCVWDVGVEIGDEVKRNEVEVVIRDVMDGKKGKEMKRRVMALKGKAIMATGIGGSSKLNFERLVKDMMYSRQ